MRDGVSPVRWPAASAPEGLRPGLGSREVWAQSQGRGQEEGLSPDTVRCDMPEVSRVGMGVDGAEGCRKSQKSCLEEAWARGPGGVPAPL